MRLLRYLYVLALVVWLGGIVVAGAIVAPSIFGVLQAWNPGEGRVLAGRVFGEVLQRLHWLAYAMGSIMFVTLTLHRLLGARPEKYGVRAGIMSVMLLMTLYTGYMVTPQVAAIQAQVSGPIAALPDTDARKVAFNRLHRLANLLLGATALGGLALLWWEARE
jgi:uncharacterized membrane protein